MITRDAGGAELTIGESLDVFKELARADGSTGWVVMASSTAAAYFSAFCPDSFVQQASVTARRRWWPASSPRRRGRPDAARTPSPARTTSGAASSTPTGSAAVRSPPRPTARRPITCSPSFPKRSQHHRQLGRPRAPATASYDYSIDSTVPADRTFSFGGYTRHRGGPMYDLGVLCLTEVGHAGWVLGVLRRRSTRRPSSPARSSA